MSGPSGAPPPSGIVRNSALSFVAPAQTPMGLPDNATAPHDSGPKDQITNTGTIYELSP